GSVMKGEYNKTSDIDIFIQTQERKIDLSKFEKKLQHSISLFFEEDIHKLSNELFNNIVNGFKISGYLKL
ncbi:MAG: nucleotidyltransferase domain-containing protein, partial [Nanoarchaeota archaeon]